MTLNDAIEQYVAIGPANKARFLVSLSHELTIHMRSCYVGGLDSETRATKLQGANELQHHLASEAGHHLDSDIDRYPDDALIRICAERATFYKIEPELAGALKRCLLREQQRKQD